MITTFEDACEFVLEKKVCTVFGSKNSPYPSLWDNTALSDEKPEGGGWSPRVMAVWSWKTKIPQTFPDTVFYGKVPGGDAVLMEMEYLRDVHYPKCFKPVSELPPLCQIVFEFVRDEPLFTSELRRRTMTAVGCTKSQFDTALKKLQISLNIVRSNDPTVDRDQWLPFENVYPEIASLAR
jgi:hypothetical protein